MSVYPKIEKLIQLTTASLLLSGLYSIVWLYCFYIEGFNVPIFQYLDPSEVVFFSPAKLLAWVLPILVVGSYLALLLFSHLFESSSSKWFLLTPVLLIVLIFIIAVIGGWIKGNHSFNWNFLFDELVQNRLVQFTWLSMILISIPSWIGPKLVEKELVGSLSHVFVSCLILAIVSLAYFDAEYDSTKIKKFRSDIQVKILLHSGTKLVTNRALRYIGKTRDFLFLFEPKDSTVRVINYQDIEEVSFRPTD